MTLKKHEYSDAELVELFGQTGRKEYAFNLILDKYKERLYWHIRKIVIRHDDADDVLQDTFVKVWNALASFRGESSLFTWLYRIATNEALSLLRGRRKRFLLPLANMEKQFSNSLEADSYCQGDEIQIKLQKAILTLPEKQRMVFNMKYFDEMKYDEIAEILDTSVGSLKASYHHAVKKIEKYLEGD